jgi:uncharacterized iron-regulated membrane protein
MTKIGMRKLWFQVHKWIGLILAILIIPLCFTGAALVWDEALDHALNPQRYATSGTQTLDPQRYVDVAKAALAPGDRISTLAMPDGAGPVVVAAMPANAKPQAGPPQRTSVYLDPPTARVLDTGGPSGLIRTMHQIHGSLLVPVWGRTIVGWIGVAMLFSSFTGIWLWWPTVGRWVRGLRWRRHNNLDTNLHHLFGFWIALPLFVLSLTGAWIAFPQVFGGGQPRGARPDRAALARAKPLDTPRTRLDAAIAGARVAVPGQVVTVAWPTDLKPEWTVTIGDGAGRQVKVDDATGTAKASPPPKEDTARLMRRIHDGTRMGLGWQILIFLGGLLPTIVAITGVIMWWRARRWKSELKAKRKARAG